MEAIAHCNFSIIRDPNRWILSVIRKQRSAAMCAGSATERNRNSICAHVDNGISGLKSPVRKVVLEEIDNERLNAGDFSKRCCSYINTFDTEAAIQARVPCRSRCACDVRAQCGQRSMLAMIWAQNG
jgi:hypothetical protein